MRLVIINFKLKLYLLQVYHRCSLASGKNLQRVKLLLYVHFACEFMKGKLCQIITKLFSALLIEHNLSRSFLHLLKSMVIQISQS